MDRKDLKLDEAKYFLQRLEKESQAPHNFHFELSAFLSAARSIVQYAYDEAKANNGLKWYQDSLSNYPMIQFFRDKRDVNIHSKPVATNLIINIYLEDTISMNDSIDVETQKDDGAYNEFHQNETKSPSRLSKQEETVILQHIFNDLPDNDVLTLCHQYLTEVQKFIEIGREKGFLNIS
jgi:hypothetical protein